MGGVDGGDEGKGAEPAGGRSAPALFSVATAFLAGVAFARAIHPALLIDSDPTWRLPRILLWLALAAVVVATGRLAFLSFAAFARSDLGRREEGPVPFGTRGILILGTTAFAAGVLLRFAALESVPFPLWVDDISLVPPALALSGTPADFADAIRPAPFGVPRPYGSVGVLYLELYRLSLRAFDTTVLGVRFPSALAGAVSLGTAALLGRALLPAGGGATALLVLAGLRWHLILSRWAWNAIVLAPIADLAAYLLAKSRTARGRRAATLAVLSGLVAGIGAHVYLAAFVVAAALLLFALWPGEAERDVRRRLGRSALFLSGFIIAVAPLFLLREGRAFNYFARTSHNLAVEVRRARSVWPLFDVTADALAAPWLVEDPADRNDLPGRSRLGVVVGGVVALALARAVVRPRRELSAFLLAHASAAFAAAIVGGGALHPNGYRFVYLAGPASVAAAAGLLSLLPVALPSRRRAMALVLLGGIAVSGAAASRDALARWPGLPGTWGSQLGLFAEDTLIGRAAVRWSRHGSVSIDRDVGHSALHWDNLAKFRIITTREREEWFGRSGPAVAGKHRFRIVGPGSPPVPGERVVELIADPWGRLVASVMVVNPEAARRGR